ncbi:MAG TPA: sialidase family protein, partial [Lentisphaeria bacterium]|nr:sialidase family protein [Lentisphaeria bacterium]
MQKRWLLIAGVLSAALLTAAEVKVDLSNAVLAGAKYADGAVHFTATETTSTAATLTQTFDVSQGMKIEFKYLENGTQHNPFPRLLESGVVSIHFETKPGLMGTHLKTLLKSADKQANAQVLVPVDYEAGRWRKVLVLLDTQRKVFACSVDGGALAYRPYAFKLPKLEAVSLILGANTASPTGKRGFNGSIRNLAITTPYDCPELTEARHQIKPPAIGGKPLEHFTIAAIGTRHLAFPGVTRLPNGDLAVVYREGEAHVCPYGRICISYSKDNGKSWSAPVAVSDTATDDRDPAIQTLSDGR